jgi:hypothetical protein
MDCNEASAICAYIQALPDSDFSKDASSRKITLCSKLAEVDNKINAADYKAAIKKLMNDIRSKTDGSLGGNSQNDWITNPAAQAELSGSIDDLVDKLNALL